MSGKTKNLQKVLLAASVFYLIVSPSLIAVAANITPGTVPTAGEMGFPGEAESPIKDVPGAIDIVKGVVKYTYIIFFIIAVLFIIFAAYKYLAGANEPENVKSAHQMLIYAAIAIAVALLAISARTIIGNFLENPTAGGGGGETPKSYPQQQPYNYDEKGILIPNQQPYNYD